MVAIVANCSHASSLLSTVLSYFYTASHASSRLVLMHCVGEAARCWSLEYLTSKQSDIVQLVLTGLRDRTGEVREASRIVFCVLYCRLLPSHADLAALDELDDLHRRFSSLPSAIVHQALQLLLSPQQEASVNTAALNLLLADLQKYHQVRLLSLCEADGPRRPLALSQAAAVAGGSSLADACEGARAAACESVAAQHAIERPPAREQRHAAVRRIASSCFLSSRFTQRDRHPRDCSAPRRCGRRSRVACQVRRRWRVWR